jgi:hypothetical protein
MVQIKVNITRKLAIRVAFISAIIGAALLLDVYFENNPEELQNIQAESHETNEPGNVYLISQSNTTSFKTPVQKNLNRKLQVQSHDKFLRKYHQVRNYQVLKADVEKQTTPLILSYHYLVFQNYFFTLPDEEPLIS